ncbi:hypothetical protein RUND412_003654 [Rhizina undulata]
MPSSPNPGPSSFETPRLTRRRSGLRSQRSPGNVEAFYLEGKELLRIQEEQEESRLRDSLRQEREVIRHESFDEDAKELSVDPISQPAFDPEISISGFGTTEGKKEDSKEASKTLNNGCIFPTEIGSSSTINNYEDSAMSVSFNKNVPVPAELIAMNESASENYMSSILSSSTISPASPILRPTLEIDVPDSSPSIGSESASAPPTPSIKPYLMPSIATTISTIGKVFAEGMQKNTGNMPTKITTKKLSTPDKDNTSYDSDRLDLKSQTNGMEHDLGPSGDENETIFNGETFEVDGESGPVFPAGNCCEIAANGRISSERNQASEGSTAQESFTPDEIFSRIPSWVRPSTSTFMSFASSPDPRRLEGQDLLDSMKPINTQPVSKASSGYFQTPSAYVTPATAPNARSSTYFDHCRLSLDTCSSFYPSQGNSRCQSLRASASNFSDLSQILRTPTSSSLTATAADRARNSAEGISNVAHKETPRGREFSFPWNNAAGGGLDINSYEEALVRGSSLAHLHKVQKRGQEDLQQNESAEKHFHEKNSSNKTPHSMKSGDFQGASMTTPVPRNNLEEMAKRLFNVTPKPDLNPGSEGRRRNFPINSPGSESASRDLGTSINSVRKSAFWGHRVPKRSLLKRGYEVTPEKKVLRNSISLGERIADSYSSRIHHLGARRSSSLAGPWRTHIWDSEFLGKVDQKPRSPAMVKSRSMTLRKSFTLSMARLRNKVSYSGFRTVSYSESTSSPSKNGIYRNDPRGNLSQLHLHQELSKRERGSGGGSIDMNDVVLGISSIEFKPSLPRELWTNNTNSSETSHNTSLNSLANSNLLPRNSVTQVIDGTSGCSSRAAYNETNTKLATAGAAKIRPWSNIYDGCVALPFADSPVISDEKADNETESDTGTPESKSSKTYFDARDDVKKSGWTTPAELRPDESWFSDNSK